MIYLENLSNLWKLAMILHKLKQGGIELIYFDELTIATRHFDGKGWSK